jgi:hypothetical protein
VDDDAAGAILPNNPAAGRRDNGTGFLSAMLGAGEGGAGVARGDPPKRLAGGEWIDGDGAVDFPKKLGVDERICEVAGPGVAPMSWRLGTEGEAIFGVPKTFDERLGVEVDFRG